MARPLDHSDFLANERATAFLGSEPRTYYYYYYQAARKGCHVREHLAETEMLLLLYSSLAHYDCA